MHPHKETDALTKFFDTLYVIDQRLLRESALLEDNQNNHGDRTKENTRRGDECI